VEATDAAPDRPQGRRARSREALVGFGAIAMVVAVATVSIFFGLRRARAAARSVAPNALLEREVAERRKSEEAFAIVSSLASAVDSLARLKTIGGAPREPAVTPPEPTEFASATSCMQSYLPEVDLPPNGLDFVCEETDLWSIEWKVRSQVANRVGDGSRLWNRLGRYSLAALASMRKGCCVDPPYLQAKVPGLWCGILRDTVRGFQPAPTQSNIAEFETMMRCLERRGMHLPSHFTTTPPERARDTFDEFVEIARHRKSDRSEASGRAP
jgi:hypothetical protein